MTTQITLLKKYGLPIRGMMGQHLLVDPNMQRKIVETLRCGRGDFVLEIGPGLGALTEEILRRGSRVWGVEKDARFVEILEGELGPEYEGRLKIIHRDILKVKLDQLVPRRPKTEWKVISNLPYYITAPILFYLIAYRRMISRAVLTMQKEVARRLTAVPGTKDYGRLTLAVRYVADVRHLFDIPSECFTPRPEVVSSVIEVVFHPPSKSPCALEEASLFHLIELAFSQRRKTFLHLLCHSPKIKLSRQALMQLFDRLGFGEKVRGEDLLLKDYINLAKELGPLA